MYLSALRRHRPNDEGFPWSVPVVAALESLEFDTPVTFFVGENGSGKSTVLEGIAAGMRAIAVGSADLDQDETLRVTYGLTAAVAVAGEDWSEAGLGGRIAALFALWGARACLGRVAGIPQSTEPAR